MASAAVPVPEDWDYVFPSHSEQASSPPSTETDNQSAEGLDPASAGGSQLFDIGAAYGYLPPDPEQTGDYGEGSVPALFDPFDIADGEDNPCTDPFGVAADNTDSDDAPFDLDIGDAGTDGDGEAADDSFYMDDDGAGEAFDFDSAVEDVDGSLAELFAPGADTDGDGEPDFIAELRDLEADDSGIDGEQNPTGEEQLLSLDAGWEPDQNTGIDAEAENLFSSMDLADDGALSDSEPLTWPSEQEWSATLFANSNSIPADGGGEEDAPPLWQQATEGEEQTGKLQVQPSSFKAEEQATNAGTQEEHLPLLGPVLELNGSGDLHGKGQFFDSRTETDIGYFSAFAWPGAEQSWPEGAGFTEETSVAEVSGAQEIQDNQDNPESKDDAQRQQEASVAALLISDEVLLAETSSPPAFEPSASVADWQGILAGNHPPLNPPENAPEKSGREVGTGTLEDSSWWAAAPFSLVAGQSDTTTSLVDWSAWQPTQWSPQEAAPADTAESAGSEGAQWLTDIFEEVDTEADAGKQDENAVLDEDSPDEEQEAQVNNLQELELDLEEQEQEPPELQDPDGQQELANPEAEADQEQEPAEVEDPDGTQQNLVDPQDYDGPDDAKKPEDNPDEQPARNESAQTLETRQDSETVYLAMGPEARSIGGPNPSPSTSPHPNTSPPTTPAASANAQPSKPVEQMNPVERFGSVLGYTARYLPEEGKQLLAQLLDPTNIAIGAAVTGGMALVNLTPLGPVADAALTAWAIEQYGEQAKALLEELKDFAVEMATAKTPEQLEESGQHLAKALGIGGQLLIDRLLAGKGHKGHPAGEEGSLPPARRAPADESPVPTGEKPLPQPGEPPVNLPTREPQSEPHRRQDDQNDRAQKQKEPPEARRRDAEEDAEPTSGERRVWEAEGNAAWDQLGAYKGQFKSKEEFLQEYRQGKQFDLQTRRWRIREGARPKLPPFAQEATPASVMATLTEPKKSLGPYLQMLERAGIKNPRQQMEQMLKSGKIPFKGVDEDKVRHALKEQFQSKVLSAMTDRKKLAEEYPGVPYEEAAHRELMKLTKNIDNNPNFQELNSKDKGNLTEAYYERMYGKEGDLSQVKLDKEKFGLQGTRQIDRITTIEVEGKKQIALQEIKNISGKLPEEDKGQFEDYMRLVNKEGGARVGDKNVEHMRYSFTDPECVDDNIGWIRNMTDRYSKKLSFEIFNKKGQKIVLNDKVLKKMSNADLQAWINGGG